MTPAVTTPERAAPPRPAPQAPVTIPLCEPLLGEAEKRWLLACVDSGYVSSVGPLLGEFERRFAARVGAGHAVATASGTAALHVALRAAGVRPGDAVAVPDLTFVASVNPVLYCGAAPVLVDVERDGWCLDPALFRQACAAGRASGRPIRAVIPVHLYGCACDMPAILDVAREFGVEVVEDATEGLGTTLGGRHAGTFGRAGCFSFNGNKMMTTGAGGMVVTDDAELARHIRYLVNQARDDAELFVHNAMGYNYRMSNLAAALGLAQLERLDHAIDCKRRIARAYGAALAPFGGVTLHPERDGARNGFWLYSLALDAPPALALWRAALAAEGIQTRRFFTPLHRQPYLRGVPMVPAPRRGDPDAATASACLAARGLHLPCSAGLPPQDQDIVIRAVTRLASSPA
jgi:perosamine synthetase